MATCVANHPNPPPCSCALGPSSGRLRVWTQLRAMAGLCSTKPRASAGALAGTNPVIGGDPGSCRLGPSGGFFTHQPRAQLGWLGDWAQLDCPLLWLPLETGLPPDVGVCVPRGSLPRGSTWRATVVKNQTEAVRPLVTPPRGSCSVTSVASVRVPTKQLDSGGDTDPCPQREECQRFFSHLNKQTFIEPVFYGGLHVNA